MTDSTSSPYKFDRWVGYWAGEVRSNNDFALSALTTSNPDGDVFVVRNQEDKEECLAFFALMGLKRKVILYVEDIPQGTARAFIPCADMPTHKPKPYYKDGL